MRIPARRFTTLVTLVCFSATQALGSLSEASVWKDRRGAPGKTSPAPRWLAALPAPQAVPPAQAFRAPVAPPVSGAAARPSRADDVLRRLSLAHGTVRRVTTPARPSGAVVVHILDVHRNAEAQENIAQAVARLIDGGVDVLGLEGAFGPLPVAALRGLPFEAARRAAADFLLKDFRLSGPTFAALTASRAPAAVLGVDDRAHYAANVAAYRASSSGRTDAKRRLADAARRLDERRGRVFSAALRKFDGQAESYHAGRLPLGDFVRLLFDGAAAPPADASLFLSALDAEKRLSFERVAAERTTLLEALTEKLSTDEADALLKLSLRYRDGDLGHAAFYAKLRALCDQKGVALDRTDDEAALVREARRARLASALVDFSLTREDWDAYRADAGRDAAYRPFESFYAEADARDAAMAGNLLRDLGAGPRTAVLVTGGFHAQGLAARLVKAGVTVITYVPRITRVSDADATAYLSVFTQEKTPLESLFSGRTLFLADHPLSPATALDAIAATGAVARVAEHRPAENVAAAMETAAREAGFRLEGAPVLGVDGPDATVDMRLDVDGDGRPDAVRQTVRLDAAGKISALRESAAPSTTARAASLLDRVARAWKGGFYRAYTGWIAPVLETALLTAVRVAFVADPTLATALVFLVVTSALWAALHAVLNRDASPGALLQWFGGGLMFQGALLWLPLPIGAALSFALHVGLNQIYLAAVRRGSAWATALRPHSLAPLADPAQVAAVDEALASERGLVFTSNPNGVDAYLSRKADSQRRPYLLVVLSDPGDLERLRTAVLWKDGQISSAPGRLAQIVRDGGILAIDYLNSNPKLVLEFNSLFEQRPYFGDTAASPALQVVGIIGDAQVGMYSTDFFNRFAVTVEANLPFDDVIDWSDATGVDGVAVEMFDGGALVRQRLIADYRLGEGGDVARLSGKLTEAIEAAEADVRAGRPPRPLIVRGGVWRERQPDGRGGTLEVDSELTRLVREALLRRAVEFGGAMRPLPPGFTIRMAAGDYGARPAPNKRLVAPEKAELSGDAWVVTRENLDLLFNRTRFLNGQPVQEDGLLATASQRLVIADRLPDWAWNAIIYANPEAQTEIVVRPGVEVPARFRHLAAGAAEEAPAPAPQSWDAVKDEKVVWVRAGDGALALELVQERLPERALVYQVTPDTRLTHLISSPEFETAPAASDGARPRRTFHRETKGVFDELRAGRRVILVGLERNPQLQRQLATALYDDPYLLDNNERVPFSGLGQLILIGAPSTDFAAPARTQAAFSETDEAVAGILEKEFGAPASGRSAFTREDYARLLRLRDMFRSVPSPDVPRLYPMEPNFSLSRLRLLYRFDNWLDAFENVFIADYAFHPEAAAYMRTMVRLTFDEEEKSRRAGLKPDAPTPVAGAKLDAVLDQLVPGAEWKSFSWQLADALGLDTLKSLRIPPDYGAPAPNKLFDVVRAALRKENAFGDPSIYDGWLGVPAAGVEAPPVDRAWRDPRRDPAGQADQVKALLERGLVPMLKGSPGTGKSTLAAAVGRRLGYDDAEVFGPLTTGPDLKEGDVLSRVVVKDGRTVEEDETIGKWARRREGGLLIVDEANLTRPQFWNFLRGAFSESPHIWINGRRIPLGARHRVVFTGNQETLVGRQFQDVISDHMVTVPFFDFDDAFLRDRAREYLNGTPQAPVSPELRKERPDELLEIIVGIYSFVRNVGRDNAYSLRDLQELVARVQVLAPADWKEADIVGIAWRLFQGPFDANQREAMWHLFDKRFGVDIRKREKAEIAALRTERAAAYEAGGVAFVDSVARTVLSIRDFFAMRAARIAGKTSLQGKRGMLFEGPSGRGKDVVLRLALQLEGKLNDVRRTGAATATTDDFTYLTASLNAQRLVDEIVAARRAGTTLVESELNARPSGFVEGKLNSALTGEAHPGFAFLATINSANFAGREKLSSALLNRLVHELEYDYTEAELETIAGLLARTGDGPAVGGAELRVAVKAHVWIRSQIGNPQQIPSTRSLFNVIERYRAGAREGRTGDAAMRDAVRAVYGVVYLDKILKRPLPSTAELRRFEEPRPVDSIKVLQHIADAIQVPGSPPMKIAVDTKKEGAAAYFMPNAYAIAFVQRAFDKAPRLTDWADKFFHESSHGLFTRVVPGLPGSSGGDAMDPLYQDLEDLRHTTAFDRYFPPARLGAPEPGAVKLRNIAVRFDVAELLDWAQEDLTPRRLFQYVLLAWGRGLLNDRAVLERLAAAVDEAYPVNPIRLALKHLDGARAIAAAIPRRLNEREIRVRQHEALTRMEEMRADFERLPYVDLSSTARPSTTADRVSAEPARNEPAPEDAERAAEKIRGQELGRDAGPEAAQLDRAREVSPERLKAAQQKIRHAIDREQNATRRSVSWSLFWMSAELLLLRLRIVDLLGISSLARAQRIVTRLEDSTTRLSLAAALRRLADPALDARVARMVAGANAVRQRQERLAEEAAAEGGVNLGRRWLPTIKWGGRLTLLLVGLPFVILGFRLLFNVVTGVAGPAVPAGPGSPTEALSIPWAWTAMRIAVVGVFLGAAWMIRRYSQGDAWATKLFQSRLARVAGALLVAGLAVFLVQNLVLQVLDAALTAAPGGALLQRIWGIGLLVLLMLGFGRLLRFAMQSDRGGAHVEESAKSTGGPMIVSREEPVPTVAPVTRAALRFPLPALGAVAAAVKDRLAPLAQRFIGGNLASEKAYHATDGVLDPHRLVTTPDEPFESFQPRFASEKKVIVVSGWDESAGMNPALIGFLAYLKENGFDVRTRTGGLSPEEAGILRQRLDCDIVSASDLLNDVAPVYLAEAFRRVAAEAVAPSAGARRVEKPEELPVAAQRAIVEAVARANGNEPTEQETGGPEVAGGFSFDERSGRITLTLGGENIDLAGLESVTALGELRLRGNVRSLAPIADLPNLVSLNLYGATIDDPASLTRLPHLEALFVDGRLAEDIGYLSGAPALKKIAITGRDVPRSLAPLAGRDLDYVAFGLTRLIEADPADVGLLFGLHPHPERFNFEVRSNLIISHAMYLADRERYDAAARLKYPNEFVPAAEASFSLNEQRALLEVVIRANGARLSTRPTSDPNTGYLEVDEEKQRIKLSLVSDRIDLTGLERIPALTEVRLTGRVRSLAPIAGLSGMNRLVLAEATVEDRASLANLRNVTQLEMTGELAGDLSFLAGATALQSVTALGGKPVSVESLVGKDLRWVTLPEEMKGKEEEAAVGLLYAFHPDPSQLRISFIQGGRYDEQSYLSGKSRFDAAARRRYPQAFASGVKKDAAKTVMTFEAQVQAVREVARRNGIALTESDGTQPPTNHISIDRTGQAIYLNLSSTKLVNLSGLESVTSLRRLYIDARVRSLAPIANLSGLKALGLSTSRVEDRASLAGLSHIETLSLSENQQDPQSVLAGAVSLTVLWWSVGRSAVSLEPLVGRDIRLIHLDGEPESALQIGAPPRPTVYDAAVYRLFREHPHPERLVIDVPRNRKIDFAAFMVQEETFRAAFLRDSPTEAKQPAFERPGPLTLYQQIELARTLVATRTGEPARVGPLDSDAEIRFDPVNGTFGIYGAAVKAIPPLGRLSALTFLGIASLPGVPVDNQRHAGENIARIVLQNSLHPEKLEIVIGHYNHTYQSMFGRPPPAAQAPALPIADFTPDQQFGILRQFVASFGLPREEVVEGARAFGLIFRQPFLGNRQVDMARLGACTRLVEVTLSGALNIVNLDALPNLRILSGDALPPTRPLPAVQFLTLFAGVTSPEALADLPRATPNLERLRLGFGTPMPAKALEAFLRLEHLRFLELTKGPGNAGFPVEDLLRRHPNPELRVIANDRLYWREGDDVRSTAAPSPEELARLREFAATQAEGSIQIRGPNTAELTVPNATNETLEAVANFPAVSQVMLPDVAITSLSPLGRLPALRGVSFYGGSVPESVIYDFIVNNPTVVEVSRGKIQMYRLADAYYARLKPKAGAAAAPTPSARLLDALLSGAADPRMLVTRALAGLPEETVTRLAALPAEMVTDEVMAAVRDAARGRPAAPGARPISLRGTLITGGLAALFLVAAVLFPGAATPNVWPLLSVLAAPVLFFILLAGVVLAAGASRGPAPSPERLHPFLRDAVPDAGVSFVAVDPNSALRAAPGALRLFAALPLALQGVVLHALGIIGHERAHQKGHDEIFAYGALQAAPAAVGAALAGAALFFVGAPALAVLAGSVAGSLLAVGAVSALYDRAARQTEAMPLSDAEAERLGQAMGAGLSAYDGNMPVWRAVDENVAVRDANLKLSDLRRGGVAIERVAPTARAAFARGLTASAGTWRARLPTFALFLEAFWRLSLAGVPARTVEATMSDRNTIYPVGALGDVQRRALDRLYRALPAGRELLVPVDAAARDAVEAYLAALGKIYGLKSATAISVPADARMIAGEELDVAVLLGVLPDRVRRNRVDWIALKSPGIRFRASDDLSATLAELGLTWGQWIDDLILPVSMPTLDAILDAARLAWISA